jgi:hypothetical protein
MNKDASRKPFIPRDKPKSWVILLIAILVTLLLGAPILFVSAIFDLAFLNAIGRIIFLGAWATGATAGCIFVFGVITGKYGDIQELPWSEQGW